MEKKNPDVNYAKLLEKNVPEQLFVALVKKKWRMLKEALETIQMELLQGHHRQWMTGWSHPQFPLKYQYVSRKSIWWAMHLSLGSIYQIGCYVIILQKEQF